MLEVKKSTATALPVTLFDSSTGNPKTGVLAAGAKCYFTKGNGITSNERTLAGKWRELDATNTPGLYFIDFTASDLDTTGEFTYIVTGTGIVQFDGMAQVVDFLSGDLIEKIGVEDADADGQVL